MVTSAVGMFGADGAGQLLLDGGDAIERQRAADADAEVDEQHGAGRPRAHAFDGDDARDLARDRGDPLADAARRGVGQRVDGAPPEPLSGDADEDRDDERRRGIGPGIAERDAATARISTAIDDHISEQKCSASASSASLDVALATRPSVRARKKSTTIEAAMTTKAAAVASTAWRAAAEEPLHRFADHDGGEHEQQRGFGERGDALHLAVAVLMLGVGGLAGNAHGEIGQHRGREIDQRMAGFRQDRERAGR